MSTAYHQLGKFIVTFQNLEDEVNDLLVLMADTDECVIRIIANDLEYAKRINTADVLFARFVDLRNNTRTESKAEFHNLMVELHKLGERRNELVHSSYIFWLNFQGNEGLLRTNSRLCGKNGKRKQIEEELQPDAFDLDLQRLSVAVSELHKFRLQIIDWLYPQEVYLNVSSTTVK